MYLPLRTPEWHRASMAAWQCQRQRRKKQYMLVGSSNRMVLTRQTSKSNSSANPVASAEQAEVAADQAKAVASFVAVLGTPTRAAQAV